MAQKGIITLDPETLEVTIDLQGFHGEGCTAVMDILTKDTEVQKTLKKPEFREKETKKEVKR